MDPLTLIGIASSILKATGLDEKFLHFLKGERGEEAAEIIVEDAKQMTGEEKPKAILQKLNAQDMLRQQLKIKLIEHEYLISKLVMEDKRNARGLQKVALQQADRLSKQFIYFFAWFWSGAATLYIGFITFMPIPPANVRFADTALGFVLGTIVSTIIGYFYGSMLKNDNS